MTQFATTRRPHERTVVAPDGSDVRVLLGLAGGGMAEFELAAGLVSAAITHRTVEEIWYVLTGRGEMWRRQDSREEVVALGPASASRFRGAPTFSSERSATPRCESSASRCPLARRRRSDRRERPVDRQPFRALTLTPSTIRRLADQNTISSGSALRTAPAMIGPYDSAA